MRRLPTFIFGMVVGGLLLYLALNYHLIRANDGVHLVPKVSATLSDTYADLRTYGPSDFLNHQQVVQALLKSGQGDLLGDAAANSLKNELDRRLPAGK
jgi:hypothetical protein